MIIVINAGGKGSRLWPLSTPDYPKHLLTFFGDRSLLQRTYDRVKDVADDVYVVTEQSHAHHVKEQLPEVAEQNIIIEPARMSTLPCLMLAMRRVSQDHGDDVPVGFLWSDQVVNDVRGFQDAIIHAAEMSKEHQKIVIIGVEPTYPNDKLGYIKKGDKVSDEDEKDVFALAHFKYQPEPKVAEEFFTSGDYLWNTGWSFAPVGVTRKAFEQFAPQAHEDFQKLTAAEDAEVDAVYKQLNEITTDNGLWELNPEQLTIGGSFDWMDVGNFRDLHSVAAHDKDGNFVQGSGPVELDDVSNSYIRNDTDHKLGIVGVDNVAVVASEDGIAVMNLNMAQKIGDVSKRFK